ncbi:MAG: 6-carboxytetrahydropterin synthase [Gemmatimonas sp.]|nr:6-carboxytetrahydropterin synthase [Gemmatimonas sp.]
MTTYLTRVVHFSAAHRYFRPEWSEERNRKAFGPCANPHGHGHNYALEVTVAGEPDPLTGFAVDLASLDRLLEAQVRGRLDHQHINHAVAEFGPGGLVPSTENLVIWIWRQIAPNLEVAQLVRLRLREEPGLFVDYYGPAEERKASPPRFDV